MKWLWQEISKWLIQKSSPCLSGSKRTTFRGAKRRCKSEWDALPWLRCQPTGWRKGQVGAETKESFLQNGIKYLPSFLNEVKNLAKDTGNKCSDLCTQACPYRLARIGTFPEVGDSKRLRKKEIIVFKIFTHTHLTRSYAGFFAKSQIIFFRPSSFRHCPSLKNDGTGEFAFEKQ